MADHGSPGRQRISRKMRVARPAGYPDDAAERIELGRLRQNMLEEPSSTTGAGVTASPIAGDTRMLPAFVGFAAELDLDLRAGQAFRPMFPRLQIEAARVLTLDQTPPAAPPPPHADAGHSFAFRLKLLLSSISSFPRILTEHTNTCILSHAQQAPVLAWLLPGRCQGVSFRRAAACRFSIASDSAGARRKRLEAGFRSRSGCSRDSDSHETRT